MIVSWKVKLGEWAFSGTLPPAAAGSWCFHWFGLSVIHLARHIVLNGDDGAEGKLLPKLPTHFMFQVALFYYA